MQSLFQYDGKWFVKVTPVKALFRSNLIHDVVNRGDVLAMNVRTNELTVIPGDRDRQMHTGELQIQLKLKL